MKSSLVAVLIALLLTPLAVADAGGSSYVDSFHAQGLVQSNGAMAGLTVRQIDPDGLKGPGAGHITQVHITAREAYALRWTETGASTPSNPLIPQFGQAVPATGQRIPEQGYIQQFEVTGGQHDSDHLFNLIARDTASVLLNGERADDAVVAVDAANNFCLDAAGIYGKPACAGYREQTPRPSAVPMGEAAQRLRLLSEGLVQVAGDLIVIEVSGLDLNGTMHLPGRVAISPVGGPYEAYFTRIILRDAHITFRVDGGHDQVAWAVQDMQTAVEGTVEVEGGVGREYVGDRAIDLSSQSIIDGAMIVSSSPLGSGLAFGLSDFGNYGVSDARASTAMMARGVWLPVALVSMLPLAGIVLAVRQSNVHTTMRDVEEALGAERFGRAARMARRILRVNPEDESAHLGRAIALTKSGQAPKAVAELHQHLTRSNPADGTLHYALSVALMDMGRDEEARAAMATAVERTPALLGDTLSHEGGAYS